MTESQRDDDHVFSSTLKAAFGQPRAESAEPWVSNVLIFEPERLVQEVSHVNEPFRLGSLKLLTLNAAFSVEIRERYFNNCASVTRTFSWLPTMTAMRKW